MTCLIPPSAIAVQKVDQHSLGRTPRGGAHMRGISPGQTIRSKLSGEIIGRHHPRTVKWIKDNTPDSCEIMPRGVDPIDIQTGSLAGKDINQGQSQGDSQSGFQKPMEITVCRIKIIPEVGPTGRISGQPPGLF